MGVKSEFIMTPRSLHIPCILDTDASDVAVGAVLSQVVEGQERPIAFFSRVMNKAQRGYCTTRRELLLVTSALQHFRHYLLGTKVVLRTDHHSLKWLNTFKRPEGILARWIETLSEFEYEIQHRPGRLHCNADGVSRPICKQCWGKTTRIPWVDQPLQRADELTEPLSVHTLKLSPELDDSDIAQMQREDAILAPVIDWLTNDYQPTPDDVRTLPLPARTLWSKRAYLAFSSGVLITNQPQGHTQLIVPAALQCRLFDAAHAGPLAAHLGAKRTLQQLQTSYYWPGMCRDINSWYQQCPQCYLSKPVINPSQRCAARYRSHRHFVWVASYFT